MGSANNRYDETHPLLDQYKKAWTTVYDSAKVAYLKAELTGMVREMHPENAKLVEYFEGQCWQIEQRWARPQESGRTVN